MAQHFMRRLLIVANLAIIGAVLFAIAAVPSGPFVAVRMAPGTSAGDTAVAVAMAGGAEKAGKSAEASAEVLAIVDGAAGAAKALERDIDGFLQKIAVA